MSRLLAIDTIFKFSSLTFLRFTFLKWIKQAVLIFVLFHWLCLNVQAEIKEINKIHQIIPYIDRDTFVVFDIDNTLIEPVGNLGSDQWFYYLYRILKFRGTSEKEIPAKAMSIWNSTQSLIKVKPVEAELPNIIKKEGFRNVKVMGLTARTLDIADRTIQQLASVGIRLNFQVSNQSELVLKKKDLQSEDDALFKNGILFVGESNNKGKALALFLERTHQNPKKIVFIDDKFKHVKNVEAALSNLKIDYMGFRYGAADQKVKNFNDLTAEIIDEKTAALFFNGEPI